MAKALTFAGAEVRDGQLMRLDAREEEVGKLIPMVECCALPYPTKMGLDHRWNYMPV
jgi:hypothetical protein